MVAKVFYVLFCFFISFVVSVLHSGLWLILSLFCIWCIDPVFSYEYLIVSKLFFVERLFFLYLVCLCVFVKKMVHIYVGLFQHSVSCWFVFLHDNAMLLSLCSFIIILKLGSINPSFAYFGYSRSLHFHMNFRTKLSVFL